MTTDSPNKSRALKAVLAFLTPLVDFSQRDPRLKSQSLNVGSHITGLGETQRNLGNVGPTCLLLIRTRLSLVASRTFKMMVTTQHAAPHILAPYPLGADTQWSR